MKIKSLSSIAIAALMLTACNKDENGTIDNLNGEIRLSSGVTVQSKASFGMDTQIPSEQTVAVYVDKGTAPATEIYGNNVLTANGAGGFTGGKTMYFPADKSKVDIYAFHTNGTLGDRFPATPIIHTVSADQSISGNYATSDLLYAAKKGVEFTKETVDLTFYHMLSKVEVALKVGEGSPNLERATVSIVGTKLKADFDADKMQTMTDPSERAIMVKTTTTDNEASDITIGNGISADFTESNISYNEAVIVPQAVAQNAKFIKVTLADGGELFHKLAKTTTFESGKKYSYKITVNLSELTVTSTIADWEPVGEPVEGDAEMEAPAQVGDFYMNDGTWLSGSTKLTEEQKAACIGIVMKVGIDLDGNWKDDCQYRLKDGTTEMNTIHGYVLALYDANDGNVCQWGSFGTEVGTQTAVAEGFDGYKNTNTIKAFAKTNNKNLQTDFPAAYYATNGYEATHAAPDNTSGWFLPSAGQCQYWLDNKTVLLASVQKATGTADYKWSYWYWSSSESGGNPAGYAWCLCFGNGSVSDDYKLNNDYVRSVLAF